MLFSKLCIKNETIIKFVNRFGSSDCTGNLSVYNIVEKPQEFGCQMQHLGIKVGAFQTFAKRTLSPFFQSKFLISRKNHSIS